MSERIKDPAIGYVYDCFIKLRTEPLNPGHPMFSQHDGGPVICCLERYAVIPMEEYDALVLRGGPSA